MASPFQVTARNDRLQPHHLDNFRAAFIGITVNVAAPATTADVSALLAAAAPSAGENAQPVTHQLSSSINQEGWLVDAMAGLVPINAEADGSVPADAGMEVYVRMSEAAGVYTASFFKTDGAGGDTAVTLPIGNYVIHCPYNFSWEKLPFDAAIRATKFRISQDAPAASLPELDHLTIATLNTFPALSKTPRPGTRVRLHVSGREFFSDAAAPLFSVAGTAITWNSVHQVVYPGERVAAEYIV